MERSQKMKSIAKIIAIVAMLFLTGCATMSSPDRAYGAVAADGLTTAIGLAEGAKEANPLGFATIPIRFAIIEHAKRLPPEEGQPIIDTVDAVGWGAAVANLLWVFGPPGLMVGGAVMGVVWESGSEKREYLRICAMLRAEKPNLVCTPYRKTA